MRKDQTLIKEKKKKDRSRLLKKIYGEINVTYIIFQMVPG